MPAPELTTQTPGEPLAAITPLAPTTETKPQAVITTSDIDATALKQAVLTEAGWLCPEPVVKG